MNQFTTLDAQSAESSLATIRPDELPIEQEETEIVSARWAKVKGIRRCNCVSCRDAESWE